jgi:putative hydrolase of the HAD superfamily
LVDWRSETLPKIEAIVFDLYGTLVDIHTNEDKNEIFDFLSRYLRYYDINIDGGRLRSVFQAEKAQNLSSRHESYPEVNFQDIFENIIKKESGLNNSFLVKSCCKLFRILSREKFQLFPDCIPVLQEMKKSGYPLALVSNAQKVFTPNEIRILDLDQFFKHMVFSTQYGFVKPDSRLFIVACGLLDVPPVNAIYIGDNPDDDVKGAKKIGMIPILLRRSLKSVIPGLEPDYYATDLWDAWEWIRKR